jgi:ABC-type dipeptide/oligopeptide/nickel transport system permease subunit
MTKFDKKEELTDLERSSQQPGSYQDAGLDEYKELEENGTNPLASASNADLIASGPAEAKKNRTLWGDALKRLRKNTFAMIALVWIIIVIIAAVTADLWVPQNFGNPKEINTQTASQMRLQPPSADHPFGTDDMGRDMFGRVIYGARVSLTVGVFSTAITFCFGILMGSIAGYTGRWVDSIIMRLIDIVLSFPYVLLAVLVMSILPSHMTGVWTVVAVIAAFGWASFARLFRSSVLSIKESDYVMAAKALGAGRWRIMFRHILPNAIAPALVMATMAVGGAILTESALSFLGLGIQPPDVSWGRMIDDGRRFLSSQPQLVMYPGLAILTTVLSFMLLGDGIRDALDTKMKDN